MSELKKVSSNPHVRARLTTGHIMFAVVIALLPTSIYGIYNFGPKAAILILITVLSSVMTELIYEIVMKKKVTISDFSAVVTGLLLALNLPVSVPWWIGVVGGVFAILVVKMLFGGLGQNFMNPALAARCFLLISFAGRMTTFSIENFYRSLNMTKLPTREKLKFCPDSKAEFHYLSHLQRPGFC